MANISLYVSGQTELNDVTEFFQKRLIGEGENPIAFFDGVFYESHQERVGNIVYQDYLIYTDKAIYLWARGTAKDYLDRFTLGAVSVNSRNKDSAFATLNLKIKREGKEPVYVIFDMVEIREAETIVKLHTVIESTIEDYLGVNYRQEIPKDVATKILQSSRNICPPRPVAISMEPPQMPVPDAGIGYGQDLLEQYKASIGYGPEDPQYHGAPQPPRGGMGMPPGMGGAQGAPEMPRGLEGMLPADPASIKRIAGQLKDMVGDAPFKLREQVMKDLQHVPNDVATVLTALNELLANIAGNPQAERFVMNAIKTAVSNDGIIGSVGKIIKLTSGIGGGGKKSSKQESHGDSSAKRDRGSARRDDSDDDSIIRRRKISVRDDNDTPGGFDPFSDEAPARDSRDDQPAKAARRPLPDEDDLGTAPARKKLSIKMEDDRSSDIARKLMSYDEDERDQPVAASGASPARQGSDDAEAGPRRKKLAIKAVDSEDEIARKLRSYDESQREQPVVSPAEDLAGEAGEAVEEVVERPRKKKLAIKAVDSEDEIARKLRSYDESAREASSSEPPVRESAEMSEPAAPAPVRKKIQVKATEEDATMTLSEEVVLSAVVMAQPETAQEESYLTLESDLPIQEQAPAPVRNSKAEKAAPAVGKSGKNEGADKPSDTHSVKAKPTP